MMFTCAKPGDLMQARQALDRHLDESLEIAARAAIFTTSGRMLADFTGDREKLHKALDSIQPWTGGAEERCPPMSYYVADLLTNKQLTLEWPPDQILNMLGKGQAGPEMEGEVQLAIECLGAPSTHEEWVSLITQVKHSGQEALAYGNRETGFALGAFEETVPWLHRSFSMLGTLGGRVQHVAYRNCFRSEKKITIAANCAATPRITSAKME